MAVLALIQRGQPGLLAHAGEAVALVVVKELRAPPLDEEQVFVAVVVVVAPDRAHGNSGARLIDVGNAQLAGDIFESAVAQVAVQGILAADGAVGHVDVRPAVAIEIDDRNRRAHRSHFRHDGIQLGIERPAPGEQN